MRHYKSEKFMHKIEVNLANVSVKPTDKFKLEKAYYDINMFDCELCGHKNCMYAYEVKNLESGEVIKVGSECVHHFADKGVDINLAEGLMRRVMAASNKARRDLKHRLGEELWDQLPEEEKAQFRFWQIRDEVERLGKEAYKKLSKQEKRELVVKEYLVLQTKELLGNVARGKSILSEDDVELIAELGLNDEMERAVEWSKR